MAIKKKLVHSFQSDSHFAVKGLIKHIVDLKFINQQINVRSGKLEEGNTLARGPDYCPRRCSVALLRKNGLELRYKV